MKTPLQVGAKVTYTATRVTNNGNTVRFSQKTGVLISFTKSNALVKTGRTACYVPTSEVRMAGDRSALCEAFENAFLAKGGETPPEKAL